MKEEISCPNCGGTNVTVRAKNKRDKFIHMKAKLHLCLDCKYSWYRITSIGK